MNTKQEMIGRWGQYQPDSGNHYEGDAMDKWGEQEAVRFLFWYSEERIHNVDGKDIYEYEGKIFNRQELYRVYIAIRHGITPREVSIRDYIKLKAVKSNGK